MKYVKFKYLEILKKKLCNSGVNVLNTTVCVGVWNEKKKTHFFCALLLQNKTFT